jgi:transcriptional regulator with XRE-family HTH domain
MTVPGESPVSAFAYNEAMSRRIIDIEGRRFAMQVADAVREARRLVGWTQRELADRARTSHTTIWRMELARGDHLDLATVERVLHALGLRPSLQVDGRHLGDRRRQLDAVHAKVTGFVARRLERHGWTNRTEVPIGDRPPRGWIDLLAYREGDASLLVEESKTELLDVGATQRSLAYYERESLAVARGLGWRPRRVITLLAALDSRAVASVIVENRQLLARAFPNPVQDLAAWIADPRCARPRGWTIAMADPRTRRTAWLLPTPLTSRRTAIYHDYADAAARLRSRSS